MEIDENYCRMKMSGSFVWYLTRSKEKEITLHYTMNVEHEHVLTDVTKIKEIFVNILSNAIKYTPSGGAVMVDVAELPCDEPGHMIERSG